MPLKINHRLHRLKKLITQIIILVTGYWLLVTKREEDLSGSRFR